MVEAVTKEVDNVTRLWISALASRSQGDTQSIKGNIEVTTEGVDYFTSAHSDKLVQESNLTTKSKWQKRSIRAWSEV